MFTESGRISCSFPACRGGSAKYQTCLIFHQPCTTLVSTHLETVLSLISMVCPILLPSCLENLAVLTWLSTGTPPLDSP